MRPIPIPQRSTEPPPEPKRPAIKEPRHSIEKLVTTQTVALIFSALVLFLLVWTARQATSSKTVAKKTTPARTEDFSPLFESSDRATTGYTSSQPVPEEELLLGSGSFADGMSQPTSMPPQEDTAPAQSKPQSSANPFAGFASRIAFPKVIPNQPTKLGPVQLAEGFVLFVYLKGGETASPERHLLKLEPVADSEHEWEIFAQLYQADASQKIAQLAHRDDGLWFTWTTDAVDHPATEALANCNFRLSSGLGSHAFIMRELQVIDRLPVQFAKATYDWELPQPPRSENLRVEIQVQSPPTVGPRRFLGSATIPANKGVTGVEFGNSPGQRGLKLKFETKLDAEGLHLTVSPWVELTGQAEPIALTSANCVKLRDSLATIITATQKRIATASPAAKTAYQQKIAGIQQAQRELTRLDSLKSVFESECQILVKVNYITEDSIAELITTR